MQKFKTFEIVLFMLHVSTSSVANPQQKQPRLKNRHSDRNPTPPTRDCRYADAEGHENGHMECIARQPEQINASARKDNVMCDTNFAVVIIGLSFDWRRRHVLVEPYVMARRCRYARLSCR